jgi:hydroxymethylglutaryl-CoA lyase
MSLPERIRITDVGPRDGLQNERATVATPDKVRFIELLGATGVAEIEVSSFVSPRWVPQLADAEAVFGALDRHAGVIHSALVPNEAGLERAMGAGAEKIAVFTAASETFSRRNTNATIQESIDRFRPVVERATAAKLPVRGYVSCAVACPFEGPIDPRKVREVVSALRDIGVGEIDLGDTIGVAAPQDIERLYDGLDGALSPAESTLHLHDTRGTALACAYRAMQLGVRSFDASCGGLGGCPYAPGATGNLATEDLVYLCRRCGIETGVRLDRLFDAARHIERALGKPLPGRVFTADGGGKGSCSSDAASS